MWSEETVATFYIILVVYSTFMQASAPGKFGALLQKVAISPLLIIKSPHKMNLLSRRASLFNQLFWFG